MEKSEILLKIEDIEKQIFALEREKDKYTELFNGVASYEEQFQQWAYNEDGDIIESLRELEANCPLLYKMVEDRGNLYYDRRQTYNILDQFEFLHALADPGVWEDDAEMEFFLEDGETLPELRERVLAIGKEIMKHNATSFKYNW